MTGYLADTSAVWRLLRGQIAGPWPGLVDQGVVSICPPVESELMVGVEAARHYGPFAAVLRRTFGWVAALDDPWRHVLAVQRDLIQVGHHRGPSPMDIDSSHVRAARRGPKAVRARSTAPARAPSTTS